MAPKTLPRTKRNSENEETNAPKKMCTLPFSSNENLENIKINDGSA